MWEWCYWKSLHVSRRILQRKRNALAALLAILVILICTTSVLIQKGRPDYQFPTCNISVPTDSVIGYESATISQHVDVIHPTDNHSLCQPKSPLQNRLPVPVSKTNLRDWSGTKFVDCVQYCFATRRLASRTMVILSCSGSKPRILTKSTNSAGDIFSIEFGDTCLIDAIDTCSKGGKPVPNVVHYIWYGINELRFEHFLSVVSVIRFMRPCLILFHGDHIPYGRYWIYLLQISPNIIHVRRQLVITVYGNTLTYKEHGADVMRIEALYEYGGLYLDFDSVLLRDVDNLRTYPVTMGREYTNNLGNQFIMAAKGAQFLQLWHEGYKNYKRQNWGWNSLYVPYNIAINNPSLIHIEGNRFTRPHFRDRNKIYNENYDWSDNYAMHLYMRDFGGHLDMEVIRKLNTTMGAVSRHILFGNKELCKV